jgi:TPR repeat protein
VSSELDDLSFGQTNLGFAIGEKVFERYVIRKWLGGGAMGVVWLAHDEELDVDVALKFLPELVALDRSAVEDLKRETRRSRELTHKNIVKVYHFESKGKRAAISMEYVDGRTLADVRDDPPQRYLGPDQILPWVEQIVDALDYAHNEAKMVHRDLKPKNIMLNSNGRIKIADFGIASTIVDSVSQLSMRHPTSGTPPYMSPQQLDGKLSTPLDDIYSLGATIYDLLTGKPPFYRGNPAAIAHQVHNVLPPSVTERRAELGNSGEPIPEQWEKTIAACLQKEPSNRPGSAKEMLALLQGQTVRPRTSTRTDVLQADFPPAKAIPVRRRYLLVTSIGLAATIGLLATFFLTRGSGVSSAERDYVNAMNYLYGMGRVRIDRSKGIALMQHAAAHRLPEAEAELASWSRDGANGLTQNHSKATELGKQAQTDGLVTRAQQIANAQYELGNLYWGGIGVPNDHSKAIEFYQKAADQGNADAQCSLADQYMSGNEVSRDVGKALELYQKAADRGYATAQDTLGYVFLNGEGGVPKDPSKGIAWFQKAADQGDGEGQTGLGDAYLNGTGVAKDPSKAVVWYQKAVDQGYADAQNKLASLYLNGIGVPKNPKQAAELFQKAADHGNLISASLARYNLGVLYLNGTGVPKDPSKAAELFQKNANGIWKNYEAACALGLLYENGTGVTKDLNKAGELYEKAALGGNEKAKENLRRLADEGDAGAQYRLGEVYDKGLGLSEKEKDPNKAAEFFQKAADQGNANAQRELGLLLLREFPGNSARCIELLQKAADQGDSEAQYWLGELYLNPAKGPEGLSKALEFLQKAADQVNTHALNRLGDIYLNGFRVSKDPRKAAEFFQKAADQEDSDAQCSLGLLYENGIGVPKDVIEAIQLYEKAAARGHEKAKDNLRRLGQ